MANSIFSNGTITIETFGSICGDMPQVENESAISPEIGQLICLYEEKSQYVDRNTKSGKDLYPNDTAEYRAEMQSILSDLNNLGFQLCN